MKFISFVKVQADSLVDSKFSSVMPNNYYDIDAILAEEGLIPCINNFDFHHLPQLDPDNKKEYLPEDSAFKTPIWAVKKWSSLGMVKIAFPRIFGRKARERLEADPSDADLR